MTAATMRFTVEDYLAEETGWDQMSLEDEGQLLRMWRFTTRAFRGKNRRNGRKVIAHGAAVARMAKNDGLSIFSQLGGMGHDLIEDTDVVRELILAWLGPKYGPPTVFIIEALTRTDKATYYSQIVAAAAVNWEIPVVKIDDRIDNLLDAFGRNKEAERRFLLETLSETEFAGMCRDCRCFIPGHFITTYDRKVEFVLSLARSRLDELTRSAEKS